MITRQGNLLVVEPDYEVNYVPDDRISIEKGVTEALGGNTLHVRLVGVVDNSDDQNTILVTLFINTQLEGDDFELELEHCLPWEFIPSNYVLPISSLEERDHGITSVLSEILSTSCKEVAVEFEVANEIIIDPLERVVIVTVSVWKYLSQARFKLNDMLEFLSKRNPPVLVT